MSARHLVSGAAGLIGFELVRQLLAEGGRVVAVDVGRKGGLAELEALERGSQGRLQLLVADLATDGCSVPGPFDCIFHLAAVVGVQYVSDHPYETLAVNLRSTLNLLDSALREGCAAFVFASSSENYAWGVERGWAALPTPEDVAVGIGDIAAPRWSYAASKIAGESAVFAAARLGGFAPIVARIHNVYGPRMGPTHVIPELLERCRRKLDPLTVFGAEQTRSFLYVDDAAMALRLIASAVRGGANSGIFNVGSADEVRIAELAQRILATSGHDASLELRPAPPGSVPRRLPDVRRLAQLGFRPTVTLEAGLRACWSAGPTLADTRAQERKKPPG